MSRHNNPNCGFQKGHPSYVSDLKTRNKISKSSIGLHVGKKHGAWRGNKVGYSALHSWVKRYKKRPLICDSCGIPGKIKNNRWTIQFANKSGKYKRKLSDWLGLCVSCHRKYDVVSYLRKKIIIKKCLFCEKNFFIKRPCLKEKTKFCSSLCYHTWSRDEKL